MTDRAAGSPVTTVISDFGGVLTAPLWRAFEVVQAGLGIPGDALDTALDRARAASGRDPLHALERGELAESAFLDELEAHLADHLGRPVALEDFPERYFAALEVDHALVERLADVRRRGYRTALLTNNVREWEPRWRAMFPADELFEVIVDSSDVGLRKPDPAIYELCCARLGVAPEACVFLDDIEVNCTAGAALGITTVHWTDSRAGLDALEDVLAARGAPPRGGAGR